MKKKSIGKNPTFFKSTLTAARGFVTVVKNEKKIRLAFAVTAIFVGLALCIKVSWYGTLFILFAWVQVIVGEIFNTSLEKAMDYSSNKEFHPLVKYAKDYAAASVFVLSILASFVSLFILGLKFF